MTDQPGEDARVELPDAADESHADHHADEPAVDEPVVDEPVVDEPVVDEPVVDEPVVDEPVVDEPVVDEPAVDEPAVDDAPSPAATVTGHPAVDEVLRSLEGLDGRPVDEHVSAFEQAHDVLRRALSDAGDDSVSREG